VQQMADLDRRGDHRSALLEQKGEVRGHRRSKREYQSEEHGRRPAVWGALLKWIGRGSLSIRVTLTKQRRFIFTRTFLSGAGLRRWQNARGFRQH
jgi:hypothetical protein